MKLSKYFMILIDYFLTLIILFLYVKAAPYSEDHMHLHLKIMNLKAFTPENVVIFEIICPENLIILLPKRHKFHNPVCSYIVPFPKYFIGGRTEGRYFINLKAHLMLFFTILKLLLNFYISSLLVSYLIITINNAFVINKNFF